MLQPTRLISTPFAQEGEKTEIQNVTGATDNSATYQLGFPPITMQSIRSGGKPPKGTDFNGVLFDITENISFLCKGGRYQYNAGLSTLIGGYPEGSNLLLDDNVTEVVSTVAGNQNNPNTDMTGWTFKPNRTTAENVTDGNQTQDQINLYGGKKYDMPVGGYPLNARVVLTNGDIVKSTVDGNANNPNSDMTGWVYSSLTPSNNLSDVEDEAEARTNLDVYSKAETDDIAGTPEATEAVAGKAKIATTAIAQEGTNDTDFLTAKKLRGVLGNAIKPRSWSDVTASRIADTWYTNTTGNDIGVYVSRAGVNINAFITVRKTGTSTELVLSGTFVGNNFAAMSTGFWEVPDGFDYKISVFNTVMELRV